MTDEEFAQYFFHPIVINDKGWRVIDITNDVPGSLTTDTINMAALDVVCVGKKPPKEEVRP